MPPVLRSKRPAAAEAVASEAAPTVKRRATAKSAVKDAAADEAPKEAAPKPSAPKQVTPKQKAPTQVTPKQEEPKPDAPGASGPVQSFDIEMHTRCQDYRRSKDKVSALLSEAFPGVPIRVNQQKPRDYAYNIHLVRSDGSKVLLWTGDDKGPPKKERFPAPPSLVVDAAHAALKA